MTKAKKKIDEAVRKAKSTTRFNILRMPEDSDEAPHWLFWLLIIVLVAIAISWIWEGMSVSSSVQAYLPYL
jgi:hypothetical protein